MTIQHRKFQLVSGLFDDSAENIIIHISIESIDDKYHIGSKNRCRALLDVSLRHLTAVLQE